VEGEEERRQRRDEGYPHTVINAKNLVDDTLVSELGEARGHQIHLSIDKDETIDLRDD
jgi:hypothetical protein